MMTPPMTRRAKKSPRATHQKLRKRCSPPQRDKKSYQKKMEEDRLNMKGELDKVRPCVYNEPGSAFSLSHMHYVGFYASRGKGDISMVYNAMLCELISVL